VFSVKKTRGHGRPARDPKTITGNPLCSLPKTHRCGTSKLLPRSVHQSTHHEQIQETLRKIKKHLTKQALRLLSPRMKSFPSLLVVAATLFAATGLNAEITAVTDPVGFMTIELPVGSDTIVAAPLTKAPVFQGAVTSQNGFVITATGASFGDLTTTPHYVQAADGLQAGMIFDVQTNSSTTITLVDNGVQPTGLSAGVQIKVIPYWTLGTLFPASDQGVSFTPSAGTLGFQRRTQIFIPDITGSGPNRVAANLYYFVTNTYWRNTSGGSNNFNNTPILPDSYFIVRNPTNAASGLKLTVAGSVNMGPMAVQLDSFSNKLNDNYVSLGRPVDITLNDLGLISSGAFTQSLGTLGFLRRDQLMVFNNAATNFNKVPTTLYYYVTNSGWKSTSSGTNDVGNAVIPAAVGYVIRKVTNNGTGTQFWTNTVSFNQ